MPSYPHVIRIERLDGGWCSFCRAESAGPWLDVVLGRTTDGASTHGRHQFYRLCLDCGKFAARLCALPLAVERRRVRAGHAFTVKRYAPSAPDACSDCAFKHTPAAGVSRVALHSLRTRTFEVICVPCLTMLGDAASGVRPAAAVEAR